MWRKLSVAVTALACLGFMPVSTAFAQAKVFNGLVIQPCLNLNDAQVDADGQLADTGFSLMTTKQISELTAMQPQIDAAVARAPTQFAEADLCGGVLTAYNSNAQLTIEAMTPADLKSVGATSQRTYHAMVVYTDLAYLAGWIHVEMGNFDKAVVVLRKGLVLMPNDPYLSQELVFSLQKTGGNQEALGVIEAALYAYPNMVVTQKAVLLRSKGFSLIELGRWAEAEAAYKESLVLEPNNELAAKELEFIAQNKPQ